MTNLHFDSLVRLWKTVFSAESHRSLPKFLAVITKIFMLPIYITFVFLMFLGFAATFLFNLIEAPVRYLHNILHNEGQTLHGAAQFIIYFFSWPIVFMYYVLTASRTYVIYVLYFFAMLNGYVASLGDFKFHIDISTEKITKKEQINKKPFLVLDVVYIILQGILFLICVVLSVNLYYRLWYNYQEFLFLLTFLYTIFPIFISIGILVSYLFSCLGFWRLRIYPDTSFETN